MQLHAIIIKFIIIKNSCYDTQIKKKLLSPKKSLLTYICKDHQANWWPNDRFPAHTVPGHCLHDEYFRVCVCVRVCVYVCIVMRYDISSVLANVITKLRCCCGFVDEMLLTVLLWFHSPKFILCICGACVFCLKMIHTFWCECARAFKRTYAHTHTCHKCTTEWIWIISKCFVVRWCVYF